MLALPVVNDTPSEVVTELRREMNNLLFILSNIGAQVDAATITATEGWVALTLALESGTDSDVTGINGGANNYTGTALEIECLKVLPSRPRGPHRDRQVVTSSDV
jgi:hypothetical protein